MTNERYKELMNDAGTITSEEAALGWHWCNEFDGLLVGPNMGELKCCKCLPQDHVAYRMAEFGTTEERWMDAEAQRLGEA